MNADSKTRLPPLKALLAFEASARLGSFAQGAEELSVTASAISHQIGQLEDFLGVQLFQRHSGRATLTPAGTGYAKEVQRAFNIIGDATRYVAPQSQGGHLVIASGPSFAAKWLQPRLSDFLKKAPEIGVRLSTLSSHEELDANRFDIAITYGRPAANNRVIEPLLKERLRPLCSPDVVSAVGLCTPADLERTTLIHSNNGLTWGEYLRHVGLHTFRAKKELWLDRSIMAIEAASKGLGVVLESEILAADELRDGRLVAPFEDPAFSVEVTSYYLVKPTGFKAGNQVSIFENWLREALIDSKLVD